MFLGLSNRHDNKDGINKVDQLITYSTEDDVEVAAVFATEADLEAAATEGDLEVGAGFSIAVMG